MNKTVKRTLKIALPIILGVFLIWYSLSKLSFDDLVTYFQNANYTWIALAMFIGLLSHLSRAYRWLYQLEPLGYQVKLGNSIMAVFVTYLINYTIPRAGEVARASILTNYEGVPFEKGFGTIVAERIADMIVMIGIILVTLFVHVDFIFQFLAGRFTPSLIIRGLVILIIALLIFTHYIIKSKSPVASRI